MKKISLWARKNPWTTRLYIIALHALITLMGGILGSNLKDLGIEISGPLLFASFVFLTVAIICYPQKKQKAYYQEKGNFYKRQKTCDWMLAFSTFLVVGYFFNATNPVAIAGLVNGAGYTRNTTVVFASGTSTVAGKKTSLKINPSKAERKAILKELKKILRESLRKNNDNNNATRITLVVLSIVGGVLLSFLLAALSCTILCNGSETLAAFVLIFGAAGIAGLLILTIRSIFKKYPKTSYTYDGKPG